ncbi:unnamed protein product, partial [Musa textilis]
ETSNLLLLPPSSSTTTQSSPPTMHGGNQANHSHHQQERRLPRFYRPSEFLIRPRPTHPAFWLVAACCTLLWVAIILAGLAILIVYLVVRPKGPQLEISGANLNGANLDAGGLLNADLSVLANFSNPNRKVDLRFGQVQLDLYFRSVLIATQGLGPFRERRREAVLRDVRMVSSSVALPTDAAEAWRAGETGNRHPMKLVASFRTRSDLSGWLHYTFLTRRHCNIVVGAPPAGVLLASSCTSKH